MNLLSFAVEQFGENSRGCKMLAGSRCHKPQSGQRAEITMDEVMVGAQGILGSQAQSYPSVLEHCSVVVDAPLGCGERQHQTHGSERDVKLRGSGAGQSSASTAVPFLPRHIPGVGQWILPAAGRAGERRAVSFAHSDPPLLVGIILIHFQTQCMLPPGKASAFLGGRKCLTGMAVWHM